MKRRTIIGKAFRELELRGTWPATICLLHFAPQASCAGAALASSQTSWRAATPALSSSSDPAAYCPRNTLKTHANPCKANH